MPSRLGDRLTQLRDQRELTTADLAQAAGTDESTMGQILAGEIARPPDSRLRGLAKVLDVPAEELISLVPEDEGMAAEDSAAAELAAVSTELGGEPPEWVQLMPAGEVRTRAHDGREPWRLADANAVVAATRAVGLPLVIDYDHQTEHAKANGQPAPAAGWIDEVEARPDGIYGRVTWTERAKAMIARREYRYLSPVFHFLPGSRQVKRIIMAGLTNDRALADIKALAKAEGTMDNLKKQLIGILKLPEDADETAIAKAVGEAARQAEQSGRAKAGDRNAGDKAEAGAMARVAAALGLAEDARPEAVEQAAAKAVAAASKAGEVGELRAELDSLKAERAEEKATAAVEAAVADGKVVPAQRDWAVGYAKRDPEGFASFVKAQPQIVRPTHGAGGPGGGGKPPKRTDGALGPEERAVARAMGVSEEEYRASAKAIAARDEEAV